MAAAVRDETVEVWDSRLTLHVKIAGDGPPLLFFHSLAGLAWRRCSTGWPGGTRCTHRSIPAPHPATRRRSGRCRHTGSCCSSTPNWPASSGLGLSGRRRSATGSAAWSRPTWRPAFPRLFSTLVLLSPLGLWRDDAPIPLMEMVSGLPSDVPKYLYAHPDSEAARAAQAMPADPAQQAKAIAQATWNVGCTTKFAWPIADHGLGRRLHRIQVPTLIVWGREDALVPVGYAKEFGRRIAGSRVEVLDDCGHVVQADQPERSWTAISRFLAS